MSEKTVGGVKNVSPAPWKITDLLKEEACLARHGLTTLNSPKGYHHVFISVKSSLLSQALYVGRRIDRLLYWYHNSAAITQEGIDWASDNAIGNTALSSPGSLWLHGLGPLAVQRTIELSLHLVEHMYPGHLTAVVETETSPAIRQMISMYEPNMPQITETTENRSAIHIQLCLLPTRSNSN